MTESIRYTPILKTKVGEMGALKLLSLNYKTSSVYPLIEANDAPDRSAALRIITNWGRDDCFMLDCVQPLAATEFFRLVVSSGGKMVPVLSARCKPEDREAIRIVAEMSGHGACIRIPGGMFARPDIAKHIQQLVVELRLPPDMIDLIIDYGAIPFEDPDLIHHATRALNQLPMVQEWRYVACAASAFPKSLSDISEGAFSKILPRPEWSLFLNLQSAKVPRVPSYADYAVTHPDRGAGGKHAPAANIRYTLPDAYLVLKGLKRNGNEECKSLSQSLVHRDEYFGPDFSVGDREYLECAHGEVGHGDTKVWRRRDTSHHIEVVIDQIASLS